MGFYWRATGDKLTSVTWAGGTKTYTYNWLGERLSMADPGNGTSSYEYDNFGRLDQ